MEGVENVEKIIGVDIDGVITDESHQNDNIWHDALCKYVGRDLDRVRDSYSFTEAYGISLEVVELFMEEKMEELISAVKPMEGAVETLRFLNKKGFKIHLITARHNKYNQITAQWLDEHQVPYISLTFSDNKAPLAVEKDIRLFVEDSSANARELARVGINVILLDKYHNKDIDDYSRIKRVENWFDIRSEIVKYFHTE